jgi:hypothetical protein
VAAAAAALIDTGNADLSAEELHLARARAEAFAQTQEHADGITADSMLAKRTRPPIVYATPPVGRRRVRHKGMCDCEYNLPQGTMEAYADMLEEADGDHTHIPPKARRHFALTFLTDDRSLAYVCGRYASERFHIDATALSRYRAAKRAALAEKAKSAAAAAQIDSRDFGLAGVRDSEEEDRRHRLAIVEAAKRHGNARHRGNQSNRLKPIAAVKQAFVDFMDVHCTPTGRLRPCHGPLSFFDPEIVCIIKEATTHEQRAGEEQRLNDERSFGIRPEREDLEKTLYGRFLASQSPEIQAVQKKKKVVPTTIAKWARETLPTVFILPPLQRVQNRCETCLCISNEERCLRAIVDPSKPVVGSIGEETPVNS